MPAVEDTLVNVEILKNLLVTRATGGQPDEADYFRVRQELSERSDDTGAIAEIRSFLPNNSGVLVIHQAEITKLRGA